jgi:hypothetical protein
MGPPSTDRESSTFSREVACKTYGEDTVLDDDLASKSPIAVAKADTDMLENSLAEVVGSTNCYHDQSYDDNNSNDGVWKGMQLAVGMVAQGDGDSGIATVVDCEETGASVLEVGTEQKLKSIVSSPRSDTLETSLAPGSMLASEDVVTGASKCVSLLLLSSV